jgi:hypothetical protein
VLAAAGEGHRAAGQQHLQQLAHGGRLDRQVIEWASSRGGLGPGGGRKPGKLVKIDEVTVQFVFDDPYFLFYDMLAGDTLIGGGQSVRQAQGFTFGAYSPKHYLQQFLPKYSSVDAANERAKKECFKRDWSLNPEVPTLGPWKTTRPVNTPTWIFA